MSPNWINLHRNTEINIKVIKARGIHSENSGAVPTGNDKSLESTSSVELVGY